jgi:hypothetical protein
LIFEALLLTAAERHFVEVRERVLREITAAAAAPIAYVPPCPGCRTPNADGERCVVCGARLGATKRERT